MTEFNRAVPRRTILAVPGSSDRFIEKARTLPVDGLFLDLEDAVAPAVKVESRARIVAALNAEDGFRAGLVTVRVNSWDSPWTYADVIDVVTGAGARLDALV
ncbi:aldolase/citrate lyase family protein, partial [Staphylococcus aureus]|uniref:aldolase/citrate lyase family protein n=1 Tax=Staphylococcus aureus TaxID=1280 RepID=UPI003D25C6B8